MLMHYSSGKLALVLCAIFQISVPGFCQTGRNPTGDYEEGRISRPMIFSSVHQGRHDDVLLRSRDGRTRRGFFATSNLAAWLGMIRWQNYDGPADMRRYIGWVSGYIDDKDPLGSGSMQRVDEQRYNTVRTRITTSTANDYHLALYNCQHWAFDMLR